MSIKEKTSLLGKRVLISGATGGIGKELCRSVLAAGGSLITLDRNREKALVNKEKLLCEFPNADITQLFADMQETDSVRAVLPDILAARPDIVVANAGAYNIPRFIAGSGYDNVFTINFISPYYLLRSLEGKIERFVAVGSIAHRYSKTDASDIDFRGRRGSAKCYGNSKRYLTYAVLSRIGESDTEILVAHPGISLTGITDHYPRWLFPIMKPIMRVIFMSPRAAARCVFAALFQKSDKNCWTGPAIFDIWGAPKQKRLNSATEKEREFIEKTAEKIYFEQKSLDKR